MDTTERLHFHFSLSCIGEGNGNPLQCSCLENPRDGGAWWAAISWVAQSRTRLKRLSSSSSSSSSSRIYCKIIVIEMSVVSNRPLEEHPLVLCPPETCLPQPWPLLFSVSWLLLYHMCSFALYMPNAFLGPDMETILILFMFHLLACSAV